ncbi:hypothetical protein CRG98_022101, partial [Punica granatum]
MRASSWNERFTVAAREPCSNLRESSRGSTGILAFNGRSPPFDGVDVGRCRLMHGRLAADHGRHPGRAKWHVTAVREELVANALTNT